MKREKKSYEEGRGRKEGQECEARNDGNQRKRQEEVEFGGGSGNTVKEGGTRREKKIAFLRYDVVSCGCFFR